MKTPLPKNSLTDPWVTAAWTKREWEIQKNTLDGRNVTKRKGSAGHDEYRLSDVVAKCAELISKRLNQDVDQAAALHEAKQAKAFEELRKLRLSNAIKAGEVVSVPDVQANTATALRALTDKLEAIPTKVRMGVADVAPNDLAAISQSIVQKRNEAAQHSRSGSDG
ncbi:MAG: hypothetical protein ABJP34_10625 [Erythrobacter sp.]